MSTALHLALSPNRAELYEKLEVLLIVKHLETHLFVFTGVGYEHGRCFVHSQFCLQQNRL